MNTDQQWLLYKCDQPLPALLLKALQQSYFKQVTDKHNANAFNLYWRFSGFSLTDHTNVQPWQLLNHFPKANAITRKDSLARSLKRMKTVHGSIYKFFPVSFNLPNDYTKFLSYYTKHRHQPGNDVWICKPSDLSRGRGIYLFSDISDLIYEGPTVVQSYISNPLLIGGYKFDLRLYVVVTSYHPLRIYIHQDGLVRFSTEKFNQSGIQNVFAHLTNTSINKYSPSYSLDKDKIGSGCKWTLSQLRAYFDKCNIDDRLVWERIKHIVTLTILMQVNSVPKATKHCIELYGFDVILDNKLKPWLLEVNFTPALGNDCQTDVSVKFPMLLDFLTLSRLKVVLPRPESMGRKILFRRKKESKGNGNKVYESDSSTEEDFFRRRFMISPIRQERGLTTMPVISPTRCFTGHQRRRHNSVSPLSARGSATSKPFRSKSGVIIPYRKRINSLPIPPSEYKVGGFYLTYPLSNTPDGDGSGGQRHPSDAPADLDVGKCVAEIRSALRSSRKRFKNQPKDTVNITTPQQLSNPAVNWNLLSGLRVTGG